MQAMGSKTFSEQINEAEKKRLAPRNKPRIGRRMPALISHKGRNDKVIGESQCLPIVHSSTFLLVIALFVSLLERGSSPSTSTKKGTGVTMPAYQ